MTEVDGGTRAAVRAAESRVRGFLDRLPWTPAARARRRLLRTVRLWEGVPYRVGMGRDGDTVPAVLSPGRSTTVRPGESLLEATERLARGEDL